jgi:hypothetical protein
MNPVQFENFMARILGKLNRLFGWAPGGNERVYAYQPDNYPQTTGTAIGQRVLTQLKVQSEAAFIWTKAVGYVTTQYSSNFSVRDLQIQVILGGSDQQVFSDDDGSHMNNSWGTATDPFMLPKPQFIDRNSNMSIRIVSLSANARTLFLDFWGYKTYALDATKLR